MPLYEVSDFLSNRILRTGIKHKLSTARKGTLDKALHIAPNHKVIYVPVPKAANTSIISILWRSQGIEHSGKVHSNIKNRPAPLISDFSNRYIENALQSDEWFRFTFVRNPYTRLLSCYRNKILNPKPQKNFLKKLNWSYRELPSFDQFVEQLANPEILSLDAHWKPQNELIISDLVPYNLIGKIESFNEDIITVLDKLSVTDQTERARALIPENRSSSIETQISQDTIQTINQLYKNDFNYFEYKMQ